MVSEFEIKKQICDIGKRIYDRGMVAANDGNISVKLDDNTFLCTPTGVSKGFMTPEYICKVDENGNVKANLTHSGLTINGGTINSATMNSTTVNTLEVRAELDIRTEHFVVNPDGYVYTNSDIYADRTISGSAVFGRTGVSVNAASGDGGVYSNRNMYAENTINCGNPVWATSDRRKKKDIEDLPLEDALKILDRLEPKYFRFKNHDEEKRIGFIAQDVQELVKDIDESLLVRTETAWKPNKKDPSKTDSEEYLALTYDDLIPILVKGYQNLKKELKELKGE